MEIVGREEVGVELERKPGFKEVGVGVGAGIGAVIETKWVVSTGGNEEMRRAREVRLEKLRTRKESGMVSVEIAWKVKESGWRQEVKESSQTKGVGKADRTRHVWVRSGMDANGGTNEWTDGAEGKRGTAITAAATEQ